MSRNPELIRERNAKIKELYNKYASEYVVGPKGIKVDKYKHKAMLVMVAKKFFLDPGTVNNILSQWDDGELDPNQLKLL
jgi:hypothetical protein